MMKGPTLTVMVPPDVESTQSLPLPSNAHSSLEIDSPSTTRKRLSNENRTRSESKNTLPKPPAYDLPLIDFDTDITPDLDLNLNFVPERLRQDTNEKSAGLTNRRALGGSLPWTERMGRRKTMLLSRPQSWMPYSKSTPELRQLPEVAVAENTTDRPEDGASSPAGLATQDEAKNISDSAASCTKRSWVSTSASPCPSTGQEEDVSQAARTRTSREPALSNSSIMKLKKGSRDRSGSSSSEGSRSNESLGKFGNYLNRIKVRPQTARVKGTVSNEIDSPASSTTSLAPASTDTRKSHASETSNSTFPDDIGRPSMTRDPLWFVFKNLEADFQRFQTKTTALKMNLIRSALIPFLRLYEFHPSNINLHHEDLERRTIILDKWWTGLLDMLHVQTHPPVTGINRPTLLDAMSSIMTRPEWRQSTPAFRPLAERNPRERVRRSSKPGLNGSTSSIHSTDSAYLAESTEHNVKNMFTANLVSQMAIVVEKMSLRIAPSSLVNFAGKACAYAFFFAPGVADVLVRKWSLTSHTLRRMADEFGLPRRDNGESDDIVALFPPCLDKLGWSSVKMMSDALRRPVQPPLASTNILWNGPWVARWNGRDSDLFFVFCKYYFLLAEGFMPPGLPLIEKARAPAFVLVNAQLLSVLDSTIHRQTAVEAMSAPLTGAFNGADTSLTALQIAPNNTNVMKGMSDNRLIALLRDSLSIVPSPFSSFRYTFAESFMAVMKAAAKHTSQFDHGACFMICDFLEESLIAYTHIDDVSDSQVFQVDWPFWFEVCKKILDSNNSMSEMRVLSLIFSLWEMIASDQSRKESVCLDWLLTEETFDKLFNNWSPMVRAYYMRLLCWRICRDAGSANESDTRIFLAVFARLKTVWSHYLWLKQHSEEEGKFPPSTAPSFPTPGKRFMIIRTEVPTVQPAFITGFDSLPTFSRQDVARDPTMDFDFANAFNAEAGGTAKKTWSLLGKVLSFTGNTAVSDDLETLRRDTAASRTNVKLPPKSSAAVVSPAESDTESIESTPTFEAPQYHFKFVLSWNNAGTMPPPNRVLTRPRLPSPAQSWVAARGQGGSLPVAGRPAPTRAVSGSPLQGLVESAKNASSSNTPTSPSSVSISLDRTSSLGQLSSTDLNEDDIPLHTAASLSKENLVKPVQPTGSFARSVKYAGRALAEWSLVVAECNGFVERRRDEGVLGLQDVEVPALGVEGLRRMN